LATFERRQKDGAADTDDDEGDDDGQANAATSGSKLYSSECCDVDGLDAWLRQDMAAPAATQSQTTTSEPCGGGGVGGADAGQMMRAVVAPPVELMCQYGLLNSNLAIELGLSCIVEGDVGVESRKGSIDSGSNQSEEAPRYTIQFEGEAPVGISPLRW
jgi:hypothetical protein